MDPCKGSLDFTEKEKFLNGVSNFKNSSIVILSTRWTKKDLEKLKLEKLHKHVNNYKNRVI